MTTPTALIALEGKLVEAKEGSREIDRELFDATNDVEWRPYAPRARTLWAYERGTDNTILYGEERVPRYTSSIDSALALVSRCLPGADVCVWTNDRDMAEQRTGPGATLWHDDFEGAVAGVDTWCGGDIHSAATPALSICLILVRALLHHRSLKGAGE